MTTTSGSRSSAPYFYTVAKDTSPVSINPPTTNRLSKTQGIDDTYQQAFGVSGEAVVVIVVTARATRSGLLVVWILVQKDGRCVVVHEVETKGSPQPLHPASDR